MPRAPAGSPAAISARASSSRRPVSSNARRAHGAAAGGDVGGAAIAGVRRGAPQHARRPRLAGGLRGEELRGDEPDVGAAGVEHPGGPPMQRRALRRGDTGERGDAQEGCRHASGTASTSSAAAASSPAAPPRPPRQGRRGRARRPAGPRRRESRVARPRRRADSETAARRKVTERVTASGASRPTRRPRRRRPRAGRRRARARARRPAAGSRPWRANRRRAAQARPRGQLLGQHDADGVRAQRRGAHRRTDAGVEQPGDELRRLFAGADGDDQRERKRLGPPREIEQEPHGGGVGPLRVIHQQRPGRARRECGRDRVETMRPRPGLLGAAGAPSVAPAGARTAAPAPAGGASVPASAGSSKTADHREGTCRSSSCARARKTPTPSRAAATAASSSNCVLPIPGGTLDQHHRAAAAAAPANAAFNSAALGLALKQARDRARGRPHRNRTGPPPAAWSRHPPRTTSCGSSQPQSATAEADRPAVRKSPVELILRVGPHNLA